MSGYLVEDSRKVTTHRLQEMKEQGKKIAMLTAYDYTTARIVDGAGIDMILVGDSASNVMAGYHTTLPITLDQMIYHAASVMRGVKRALVVLKAILEAGIPVMGHLGLMPQSINKFGTYAVRAREAGEAERLKRDAAALAEAGCFGLVLEKIPAALATEVAQNVKIPVVGIGAGGGVDGQVLVVADMLGMNQDFSPKFLRRYADLQSIMTDAIGHYITDVKNGDFPNTTEQY